MQTGNATEVEGSALPHTCTDCAASGPSLAQLTRAAIEPQPGASGGERLAHQPPILSPYAVRTYRIGFASPSALPDDDDDYDLSTDADYEPPTDAFLKRFCPEHYEHVRRLRYAEEHPDPDVPTF